MPATIEEVKQYVTIKLRSESPEELADIKAATERQLSSCLPEHKHVLESWIEAIDGMLGN